MGQRGKGGELCPTRNEGLAAPLRSYPLFNIWFRWSGTISSAYKLWS